MTTGASILLVEDSEDDVFLMRRALKAAGITNPLHVVEDGQEAVDYLSGAGKFSDRAQTELPAVVFLDLKLPVLMGIEVLAWIRSQPSLANIVVVVLTSSNEPSDLKEAYRLGANSYIVKPPTADQLLELAQSFRWYWLEFNKPHPTAA
jgi:CheY-like chemotaxis protein